MILVRNVFHCKPGMAKDLVARLKATAKVMKSSKLLKGSRVMTDTSATFWTVVLETEHASLEAWEKSFKEYGSNPKVRKAMGSYMDFVVGGHRELWNVE
jgi:hypothetical protein